MWRTPGAVAYRLGMPLLRFQFFRGLPRAGHAAASAEAYRRARTPNPCIECNRRMKFDAALSAAPRSSAAKMIVTGHYARIARAGGEIHSPKGARPDEGPELCALCHDAAGSLRTRSSRWGPCARAETRRHRRGRRASATRAKAGQPGYLLCAGRRLCRRHRAADGGKERSRRIRLRRTGAFSASIRGSFTTRSASAAVSAFRTASGCTSAGSIRRETRSSSAKRRTCTGAKRRYRT